MMPLVALFTCIMVGWFIGTKTITDEVTRNGEKFGRKRIYEVMIKYVAPTEVEVPRGMELTVTNRSQAYPKAEKADTDIQEREEALVLQTADGCTDTFAQQRYRENEVFEISGFEAEGWVKDG